MERAMVVSYTRRNVMEQCRVVLPALSVATYVSTILQSSQRLMHERSIEGFAGLSVDKLVETTLKENDR